MRKFAIIVCVMKHVLTIHALMFILRDDVTAVNQCLHFIRIFSHAYLVKCRLHELIELNYSSGYLCRNSRREGSIFMSLENMHLHITRFQCN